MSSPNNIHPLSRQFARELTSAPGLLLSGADIERWHALLEGDVNRDDAVLGILAIAVKLTQIVGTEGIVERIIKVVTPFDAGGPTAMELIDGLRRTSKARALTP